MDHRLLPLLLLLPLGACSGESDTSPAAEATERARSGRAAGGPRTAEELLRAGHEATAKGNVESALEQFRRALKQDPDLVEAHFALGTALVPLSHTVVLGSSTRDFAVLDEAIEHLQTAVAARPEDADYAYWAGRALDLRGRDEEARELLEKAIELDPDHGPAQKRLGLVHNEAGRVAEARTAFERAAELMPDDAGSRFQLGNLWLEEDPEKARDLYLVAIEADPTHPWSYNGLSQALAQLGDVAGAQEAQEKLAIFKTHDENLKRLTQVAAEKPKDSEAQFAAAEMYYLLNKEDEALRMFLRTIDLDPANAYAHYYCGLLFLSMEDYEASMNHLEESLFFAPDEIGPQIELVRVYHRMENAARVGELAEKLAPRMEGADAATRNAFAEVLLEVGRHDEATALLRSVLDADAENEDARILLERATQ
jgi:tetratricopeptide (TPR) repeat protein